MKIINVRYSRNGSGTADGFFKVLFEDNKTPKEYVSGECGNKFLATFQTCGDIEVMNRDTIRVVNIKNFELNFDGQHFARLLSLQAINDYCNERKLTEISWCAAAFPSQYKQKMKAV